MVVGKSLCPLTKRGNLMQFLSKLIIKSLELAILLDEQPTEGATYISEFGVMQSAAGYYIGRACVEWTGDMFESKLPSFLALNDIKKPFTSSSNQPTLRSTRLTLDGNRPSFSKR